MGRDAAVTVCRSAGTVHSADAIAYALAGRLVATCVFAPDHSFTAMRAGRKELPSRASQLRGLCRRMQHGCPNAVSKSSSSFNMSQCVHGTKCFWLSAM